MTIEPFDLRQPCRYDLVIDRLTHWYHTSREWIKKAILMDGLYVFNNPWSMQSMEKHTTYCAMMHLGMPIPETWMVPPKAYEPLPDLQPTLQSYARLFDLGARRQAARLPDVHEAVRRRRLEGRQSRSTTRRRCAQRYDESGKLVMHLQEAVDPFDRFVRCIGLGPQTQHRQATTRRAPLHDRYTMAKDFVTDDEASILRDTTLTINAFFGWDFNSCEALHKDGAWYPIDFANPCPDSQVTSLHYHFPWLVMANIRWSVFCAATKRPMRRTLDWEPFYDDRGREGHAVPRAAARLRARSPSSASRPARFEEFCARHLGHLDEVAYEFFATRGGAGRGAPEGRRAVPGRTRSRRSPSSSGSRIQAWREDVVAELAMTRRPRAGTPSASSARSRLVRWGTYGQPVLLFPTAGGDAEEIERFLLDRRAGRR